MITTTLGDLVNAEAALAELAKQRLPAKTAYQISKLCRLVPVETKHFHEQREALIKELGAEREQDGQKVYAVLPEKTGEFIRRLNELAAVPVELNATPIPFAELGDISISGGDILALGELLLHEAEEPKASPRAVKRRGAA